MILTACGDFMTVAISCQFQISRVLWSPFLQCQPLIVPWKPKICEGIYSPQATTQTQANKCAGNVGCLISMDKTWEIRAWKIQSCPSPATSAYAAVSVPCTCWMWFHAWLFSEAYLLWLINQRCPVRVNESSALIF